jgi:protein-disulfide isomerase
MASTHARRSAARARPRRHRRRLLVAIAAGAFALVTAFIAIQALSGGSTATGDIPPRLAETDGRILGDPEAPVTIIEYADFQCPVCKRAEAGVISRIEREYIVDGLVNVEFRHYPFLGPESLAAAVAADAALEQGAFWEYHDALFNAQGRENSGAYGASKLVALAEDLGLDARGIEAALADPASFEAMREQAAAASAAGINSTPMFIVGETAIRGAQPYEVFQQVIESELAKAGVR